MKSKNSYKDYYTEIGDLINAGDEKKFGAYVIERLPTTDANHYNILVFGSLFSDASFGSFTSVLLESIARSFTEK